MKNVFAALALLISTSAMADSSVFCKEEVEQFVADQVGRSKEEVTVTAMPHHFEFLGPGSQYKVEYSLADNAGEVHSIVIGIDPDTCRIF